MEPWRSAVRIWVTYIVTLAYTGAALYLIYWLTNGPTAPENGIELAIAVFAGLSSVASGVIGFWFGNRKAVQEIKAGS